MIKTLNEIMKANPNLTYNEAVKIQKDMRVALEDEAAGFKTSPGVCITGALKKDINQGKEIDYHRYWKDMYEKEHKLRQEAQGETTIVKGIGMSSPEMKEAKRTIKNLEIRLAELLQVNDSHQQLNGKLQERLTEVEEDNKKMALQIEDKIDRMRKSGM